MKLATAHRLEAEAKAKPVGVHVIRDPEGAIVAKVSATDFTMILIDAGTQLEDQIKRAEARLA